MKLKLKNIGSGLLFISFLTVSFDVFLNIKIGFNFRITQIFLILFFGLSVLRVFISDHNVQRPIGIELLLSWTLFIFLFIPNTSLMSRSIGYAFWLTFNIILIFFFVYHIKNQQDIKLILKLYLFSFFIMAVIGLIQFLVPLIGLYKLLPSFLYPRQWWIFPVVARINGFSYEPSSYASYMTIGFILSSVLSKYNSRIFSGHHLRYIRLTILFALFLSSSRMGWVIIFLWYFQYVFAFIYKMAVHARLNIKYASFFVGVTLLLPFTINFLYSKARSFLFLFLAGTGAFGIASHSVSQRFSELIDTLAVFIRSPIIGYSFGGLPIAIANLRGKTVDSLEDLKDFEPMGFFPVILAASGIIGFIFFVVYLYNLFRTSFRVSKRVNQDMKVVLLSMLGALFFELIILQLTQNPLQIILWLHIGLLTAFSTTLKNHEFQ